MCEDAKGSAISTVSCWLNTVSKSVSATGGSDGEMSVDLLVPLSALTGRRELALWLDISALPISLVFLDIFDAAQSLIFLAEDFRSTSRHSCASTALYPGEPGSWRESVDSREGMLAARPIVGSLRLRLTPKPWLEARFRDGTEVCAMLMVVLG